MDHMPLTRNFVAEPRSDPYYLEVALMDIGIPTLRPLTWPFSGGKGTRTLGLYVANVAATPQITRTF
jgi:hypothetical protein